MLTFDLHRLTENVNTAIVVIDADFVIQYCNFAGQRLFRRSLNQIVGSHLKDHFFEHTYEAQRLDDALSLENEFTETEVMLHFRDDRYVLADITVTSYRVDEQPHLIFEIRQIDQLKRISQETQQHAQQIAARQLIRGLAHEIKNPLGGIRGAAQLLEKTIHDGDVSEYTAMIIQQADRLRNLVDRLLGPNTLPQLRLDNLHKTLETVRTLVSADDQIPVTVTRDYDPSIPDMLLDTDMVQQAVLNIVRNAQQALNDAQTAEPEIKIITRIERQMMIHGKRFALCAQIKIIDNGPGIPRSMRDTLFYPMVSSKPDGNGLGLSIAQTLIDHHQGKIELESRRGYTAFTIFIPIKFKEHTEQ